MKSSGTVKDVLPQLQVIERNGKRLLTLVNQLMDFRKAESGGMNVILAETNIKTLLMNVYQRFQLSADIKHIKISLTMPEESCYARAIRRLYEGGQQFIIKCIEVYRHLHLD